MKPIDKLIDYIETFDLITVKEVLRYAKRLSFEEEWISIHDRKNPIKKDVDCLLLFETGEIKRYYEDYLRNSVITHWMPLPQKPNKKINN
jgi:hypothetical protein